MSNGSDTSLAYDIAVIGGGAAGLGAVDATLRAGGRVVLITDEAVGGDCTFTGCVPSKTLIEAAARRVRFTEAMTLVRSVIARIAATETAEVLRARGADVITGSASLIDPHTVAVAGQRLVTHRIVIATGSAPTVPPIEGLETVPYLTTDTVFDLTEPPESLLVIGGGAVACELAQAFARLGVQVCIVEMSPRLLPDVDPDASRVLTETLVAEGIAVHTNTTAVAVRSAPGGGVLVRIGAGAALQAQRLMVAVGRTPTTSGLNLASLGVRQNPQGHIIVDRHMATGVAGVYAAGDVTGLCPLTHAAHEMGRLAVAAASHRVRRPSFDPLGMPAVVFTDPEIATVGRQEHRLSDTRALVAELPLSEVDRAITAGRTDGFVKIISGPRPVLGTLGGGRVLGATIVAARAGEMIHELALAISTGMFTGRLAQTTHAYPTWSTAVQQAAAQFFGYGDRRPRPARRASIIETLP